MSAKKSSKKELKKQKNISRCLGYMIFRKKNIPKNAVKKTLPPGVLHDAGAALLEIARLGI